MSIVGWVNAHLVEMPLLLNISIAAKHASHSTIPKTGELVAAVLIVTLQGLCVPGGSIYVFENLAGIGGLHNALDLPRVPVKKLVTVRV
jgi:hypothetical protein